MTFVPLIPVWFDSFEYSRTSDSFKTFRDERGNMSSIEFEQQVTGEEICKMTMQWDYANVPKVVVKKKKRKPIQFTLPNWIKSLIDVCCTLLGSFTTILIIALLLGWRPF